MSLSHHVPHVKATVPRLTRFDEVNQALPKYELPRQSISSQSALKIVRNELRLDGNPSLNFASFVTTEIEDEALTVMMENMNKNLPDTAQYPQVNDLQDRCVNILANLFHAPTNEHTKTVSAGKENEEKLLASMTNPDDPDGVISDSIDHPLGAVGTATIGSSEAILLAGLALKWHWRSRMAEKQGKKAHEILQRPNLIFSAAVHVSVLKLCRYFDIEARIVPLEKDKLTLDINKAVSLCDENTCGVLAVLGTTLTGEFEDIEGLNNALDKLQESSGLDIPIHVDGASGAMIAPFVYPDHLWDFRLKRVKSINMSGHKFGLSLPGLGWVIWRTTADLPEDLVFHVNYLGVDEATFTLNFSRSAGNVAVQYYQFLRLGFEGYQKVVENQVDNARYLAAGLKSMAPDLFLIHSTNEDKSLPLVAFSFNPSLNLSINAPEFVSKLREVGFIIPAYSLPANVADTTIMRVVVRETFTRGMADMLLDSMRVTLISLAHRYDHPELIDQLKQSKNPHHIARRNIQHQQKTRNSIKHHHHDHHHHHHHSRHDDQSTKHSDQSINHPDKTAKHTHSAHRDAEKVHEMSQGGDKPVSTKDGPPTSHTIC